MIKKLICIFIGLCMAVALAQCSPQDVQKESDQIVDGLLNKPARQKEAVELSMAEARFNAFTAENISKGASVSTVTLDNQSGEDALVKLISVDDETLWLPVRLAVGSYSSISIIGGRYYTKVRYGGIGNYRYMKEAPFESAGGIKTVITLQKRSAENPSTNTISAEDF